MVRNDLVHPRKGRITKHFRGTRAERERLVAIHYHDHAGAIEYFKGSHGRERWWKTHVPGDA